MWRPLPPPLTGPAAQAAARLHKDPISQLQFAVSLQQQGKAGAGAGAAPMGVQGGVAVEAALVVVSSAETAGYAWLPMLAVNRVVSSMAVDEPAKLQACVAREVRAASGRRS